MDTSRSLPRVTCVELPPECLLQVIEFLTLPDVAALLRTSKFWYSLINESEHVIYRRLAATCDSMDVPAGSLGGTPKGWASPEAARIRSWRQYCQLQAITKQRWRGKERAYLSCDVFGSMQEMEAHRIKIDTEKALLVMSGEGEVEELDEDHSSLVVHCLRNPERPALFRLDQISVYAHVEMSNGFIVFTCGRSRVLQVWRWAQDQATEPLDRKPTDEQTQMYESAVESTGFSTGSPYRGELVPMGVLRHPAELRASRLVYPTLCVGSTAGDQIWLWDIRTRCLTQTIRIEPSRYISYAMVYVDVNETHVFVATHTVSVYSRASGQLVFRLADEQLALLGRCVQPPPYHSAPTHRTAGSSQVLTLPDYHYPHPRVVTDALGANIIRDIVLAVHVSPTGDDFVALTYEGLLIHVSGLRSKILDKLQTGGSNTSSAPTSHVSNVTTSSANFKISVVHADGGLGSLAYDGNRILAFGTSGLCILPIESQSDDLFEVALGEPTGPTLKLHPFPSRIINRIYPVGYQEKELVYAQCSALQMTQDSVWIAWDPTNSIGQVTETRTKVVGMIDFARSAPDNF